MNPTLSVETFLELLRRSGLVEAERLERVLQLLEAKTGCAPSDSETIGHALLQAKLITPWHQRMLQKGLWRGFFLGRYLLLEELGQGGMSSVYLAEHTMLKRRVAIKVLHQKRASNRSHLARFYRESRSTAALDHPNIVRVFDFDTDGKFHYMVMEYVPGTTLQALVDEHGPLKYRQVASYIAQAAEGLAYAHAHELIHRDIKPGNLLITEQGIVKITDLGLARISAGGPSLTLDEGSVLGTVDYMAPEQALDSHHVNETVDQYSLGCTMYFLLTGMPPFPTGTMALRLMQHQTEEPPELAELRPDIPSELVEVCGHMMRKLPHERPAAREIQQRLTAWLNGAGQRYIGEPTPELASRRDLESGSGSSANGAENTTSAPGPTVARKDGVSFLGGTSPIQPALPSVKPALPSAETESQRAQSAKTTPIKRPETVAPAASTAPIAPAAPVAPPAPVAPAAAKIPVPCPNCRALLQAPAARAGLKAKCPVCGTVLLVPKP